MTEQHSPGPWHADMFRIRDCDGNMVAVMTADDEQQAQADSQLIAAVPELLKALLAFATSTFEPNRTPCWCGEDWNSAVHAPRCQQARSVVAKVRGEHS